MVFWTILRFPKIENVLSWLQFLNPFQANAPSPYPVKTSENLRFFHIRKLEVFSHQKTWGFFTSENLRFFHVFRRYRNGALKLNVFFCYEMLFSLKSFKIVKLQVSPTHSNPSTPVAIWQPKELLAFMSTEKCAWVWYGYLKRFFR